MSDQGNSTGSPTAEKVTDQKMDAALKAKWVGALRSGEFKQGRFYFEKNEMFCCLGVLCKVAGEPLTRPSEPEHNGEEDNWPFIDRNIPARIVSQLVDLNDDEREPFPAIADFIEANL